MNHMIHAMINKYTKLMIINKKLICFFFLLLEEKNFRKVTLKKII